jgi:hypothetical protein
MSRQFESLFKDLASGMSRRAALRRFFIGVAGAAGAVLTGGGLAAAARKSDDPCVAFCEINENSGFDGDQGQTEECVARSKQCPAGQCAKSFPCSSGQPRQSCGGENSDWVCVPAN